MHKPFFHKLQLRIYIRLMSKVTSCNALVLHEREERRKGPTVLEHSISDFLSLSYEQHMKHYEVWRKLL